MNYRAEQDLQMTKRFGNDGMSRRTLSDRHRLVNRQEKDCPWLIKYAVILAWAFIIAGLFLNGCGFYE